MARGMAGSRRAMYMDIAPYPHRDAIYGVRGLAVITVREGQMRFASSPFPYITFSSPFRLLMTSNKSSIARNISVLSAYMVGSTPLRAAE